jgi:hypothetical protein
MLHHAKSLLLKSGIDASIGLNLLSQVIRILTGPVTAYLLITHLSPTSQGLFYTISSISSLQIIFESGMGQCILQSTSKRLKGNACKIRDTHRLESHDEIAIAPVFCFAIRFYSFISLVFVIVVGAVSFWFFQDSASTNPQVYTSSILSLLGTSLSMCLISFSGVLEGAQQISSILRGRLLSSIAQFATTAVSLICGLGVLTAGITAMIGPLVFAAFLMVRWGGFFTVLWQLPSQEAIDWKSEIWPFQKRMMVNSLSAYAAWSLATPLVFKLVNPIAAGQYALSWGILRSISGLSASWTYNRLGKFGQLIHNRKHHEAQALVAKHTIQGLLVNILGAICYILCVSIFIFMVPSSTIRFGSFDLIFVLSFVNAMQTYLLMRAHLMHAYGADGFVEASVIVTIVTVVSQLILAPHYGAMGAAVGMLMPLVVMVCISPILVKKTIARRVAFIDKS